MDYGRFWQAALPVTAVLVLVACSGSDEADDRPVFEKPATSVDYTVTISGLPEEPMLDLAESSLATFRRQEDGAQSLAFLRRRAESDVALVQKLLRSRGYYAGKVDVETVAGTKKPDEDAVQGGEDAPEAAEATVTFTVEPGPAFTLVRHDFRLPGDGTKEGLTPAAFGSPVGVAADAEAIVNAETAAVDDLKNTGFPYARRGKRRAVADLEQAELEIDTPIAPGPLAIFGPVIFEGLDDVRERYLRTYLPWIRGDVFDLSELREYQQALLATDLFETINVRAPKTPPEGGEPVALPVQVVAEERPFRTVSAGARFSTDEGPSITGGFEHRNLFGENETLTVEAELGVQVQSFGVGYREPQYMRPGQDLLGSLVLQREEDDAFDQITATATLGIQRRLTPRWIVGVGGLIEASLIEDNGVDTEAYLGGIPTFAEYDSSDDALDPSEGERLRLELTPFAGVFDGGFAGFLTLDATGSTYYDLFSDRKYIFAARARLASILAEDLEKVPQTRRLYSGGGGSVRGFAQRFVGPLDALNDPIGGLSAAEIGGELRARLFGDLGGTVFVEAGTVGEEILPDFNTGVQVAAGVGFRYFSPAGPIRVDVALPLNPRDADDRFQLYFSIGQAF
ncbi:MAG: autotransporter assembly complex family protein [Pseudomonadota bacterium]